MECGKSYTIKKNSGGDMRIISNGFGKTVKTTRGGAEWRHDSFVTNRFSYIFSLDCWMMMFLNISLLNPFQFWLSLTCFLNSWSSGYFEHCDSKKALSSCFLLMMVSMSNELIMDKSQEEEATNVAWEGIFKQNSLRKRTSLAPAPKISDEKHNEIP